MKIGVVNKTFLLLLILTILYSCKTKNEHIVMFDAEAIAGKSVIIDDTLKLDTSIKTLDSRLASKWIKEGLHHVTIDGGEKKSFTIGKKSGYLNIEREEYVIFPYGYVYAPKDTISAFKYLKQWPIVIDSFIVMGGLKSYTEKMVLDELQQNDAEDIFGHDLKKIDSGTIYIERNWTEDMFSENLTNYYFFEPNSKSNLNELLYKISTKKAFLEYVRSMYKMYSVIKISDWDAVNRIILHKVK